jgi:hypothetical protein
MGLVLVVDGGGGDDDDDDDDDNHLIEKCDCFTAQRKKTQTEKEIVRRWRH